METIIVAILTAIAGVLGSNGIWTYFSQKSNKNSIERKALMGLIHNRICELCEKYIVRGYILEWEYEDLISYMYQSYKTLGGNGTAEKLVKEVEKLPIYFDEKGATNGNL